MGIKKNEGEQDFTSILLRSVVLITSLYLHRHFNKLIQHIKFIYIINDLFFHYTLKAFEGLEKKSPHARGLRSELLMQFTTTFTMKPWVLTIFFYSFSHTQTLLRFGSLLVNNPGTSEYSL